MSVESQLRSKIPAHMFPGNVGNQNKVIWPFHFTVEFDFGANAVWSSATRLTKFFQVTQDAGFLLTGIARSHDGFNAGNELAPLGIDIRDRQSARQFNNAPIPLQAIGRHSKYTRIHEPLWINPAAFVDVTITSLLNTPTAASVAPSGKMWLTFFGYRMRNPQGTAGAGVMAKGQGGVAGFDHLGALRPPNIGKEGSIMWPYFFACGLPTATPDPIAVVNPGQGVDASFTVSQEAAFIATHWQKVVYLRTGAGPYTYTALDPTAQANEAGNAPGLFYTLQDPQSGRVYNFNPTAMDFLGDGDFPTELASPQLLLPNSVFIARYQNQHPTNVYVPTIIFFGYRIRLEDMDQIQSLTTG